MNNAKNTPEREDELSREGLIVPEEIFAPEDVPEEEETLTEQTEEFAVLPEFSEDETEKADEDVQISFFAEESPAISVEAPEGEEKSTLLRFEEKDEEGYDPKRPRLLDKAFDLVELFAFTVAVVFILTTLLFRHAIVDGPSMDKTLAHGEHLIISDLFYEPKRGDVIVFEDYSLGENLKKPIVKRVIALAGDTVEIDLYGKVFVNGLPIDESEYKYLDGGVYKILSSHIYANNEKYTVPEGTVFVLGDNRNNSADSRSFGAISTDAILGEVKLRFWPISSFGAVD